MYYKLHQNRLCHADRMIREYATTQLYFGLGGEESSVLFHLLSAIDAAEAADSDAVRCMGKALLLLSPGRAGGYRDPELAEIANALLTIS